MLVLSRRRGESIAIGNYAVITLVSSGPSRAKIGISAPLGVHVVRTELLDLEDTVLDVEEPLPLGGRRG